MSRRFLIPRMASAAVLVLTMTSAVRVFAGGPPSFSFESPSGAGARQTSGPVLIVHAYSCHAPTDAAVTASAEGLVGGQRRSIPLQLKSAGQLGVYEVSRQWPAEGSWALVFSIDRGGQTTALVKLDVKGEPIFDGSTATAGRELSGKTLRTVSGKPATRDIDAVLTARLVN